MSSSRRVKTCAIVSCSPLHPGQLVLMFGLPDCFRTVLVGNRTVTEKRTRSTGATITDMETFLNSSPIPGEGRTGEIRSLWSIVRTSLTQCDAIINLTTGKIPCNGRSFSWEGM